MTMQDYINVCIREAEKCMVHKSQHGACVVDGKSRRIISVGVNEYFCDSLAISRGMLYSSCFPPNPEHKQ